MASLAHFLRRFPTLFDRLHRLNRQWRHQSPMYLEISKHLPKNKPFTFLQIGANDGISKDPFREFMIRPNARGVTTEPVPEYFATMQATYRAYPNVIPANYAIGYPAGNLPFYAYSSSYLASKGGTEDLAGLAGFSREKLVASLQPSDDPNLCVTEIIIPVSTIESALSQHGFDHFDCLFMDCEGHEQNILTHMDYAKVKPRLIVFEHTHYGDRAEAIETHLAQHGFTFTRLQYDTIASR
jgi:FkbM family methyltransferase